MKSFTSIVGILVITLTVSWVVSGSPMLRPAVTLLGSSKSNIALERTSLFGLAENIEDYKLNNELPDKIFKESLRILMEKLGFVMADFYKFNFERKDELVVRVKSLERPSHANISTMVGLGYVKYLKAPITDVDDRTQRIVTVKEIGSSYNKLFGSDIMFAEWKSFYPYNDEDAGVSTRGLVVAKKIPVNIAVEENEIVVMFVPIFSTDPTNKHLTDLAVEYIKRDEQAAIYALNNKDHHDEEEEHAWQIDDSLAAESAEN